MNKILLILVALVLIAGVIKFYRGGFSVSDVTSTPGGFAIQMEKFWHGIPQDPEAKKEYILAAVVNMAKQAPQAVFSLFGHSSSSTVPASSSDTSSSGNLLDSIPYSDQVIHGFDQFWDSLGNYAEQAWLYIIHTGF